MTISDAVIVALIGLLAGLTGPVIVGIFTKRKTDAEAEKGESEANKIIQDITDQCLARAEKIMEGMQQEIDLLKVQNKKLQIEVNEIPTLKAHIRQLQTTNDRLTMRYLKAAKEIQELQKENELIPGLRGRIQELEKRNGTGPLVKEH